jgi:mannose-1-phosphate guanylyltransferase
MYHKRIESCLKRSGIPPQNVLFEPQARNTLAPIATLSEFIHKRDKDAVILVLPSDHYVKNEREFLRVLDKATRLAGKGYIVTLGIKPDRPETGYGYMKVSSGLRSQVSGKFYKVGKFIEKPDYEKAKELIKNKRAFWNGGIFVFRADTLLGEIKRFLPSDFKVAKSIRGKKSLDRIWGRFSPISIDYAVMEKTRKLALVPCDCGWSDLGSWRSVEQFFKKDKSGNIFKDKCIDIGSKNIFCWPGKRILATAGLENIIIVDTDDALLVCAKNKAQDVKRIVQALEEKKLYKQI